MVDWDVASRKPWSFVAALLSMGQICGGCDLRSLPKSPPRDLYPLLSNMAIESAPQIMVQWENHPEVGNLQLLKHPKKEYNRAKTPCLATKYRVHPGRNPGFMLDMFIEDPKELRGMTALGVFRVGPKVSGLMRRIIPLETAFPFKYGHKQKLTVHLLVES